MGYMENTLIHPNKRFRRKYDLSLKLYCDGLKSTTGVQLSTTFIHLMERYEKWPSFDNALAIERYTSGDVKAKDIVSRKTLRLLMSTP
jgi:hypothetical protein